MEGGSQVSTDRRRFQQEERSGEKRGKAPRILEWPREEERSGERWLREGAVREGRDGLGRGAVREETAPGRGSVREEAAPNMEWSREEERSGERWIRKEERSGKGGTARKEERSGKRGTVPEGR
jgi:hypothetical protein